MAQTTSHITERHGGNRNATTARKGRFRGRQVALCTLMAAIVVCGAAPAWGSSGPGVAFKVGAQTIESPISGEDTTRTRYEIELASALFCDDHLDLAFTVGGSSLGSFKDERVEVVDGVLFEDFFSDDLSLLDIRLALRLYPFGDNASIRPYVGAGVGYFWFLDSWADE